jgi:hypothetical protein
VLSPSERLSTFEAGAAPQPLRSLNRQPEVIVFFIHKELASCVFVVAAFKERNTCAISQESNIYFTE